LQTAAQGLYEKQGYQRVGETQVNTGGLSRGNADGLRQELRALRERNLNEASFEEKADLVAMLGIKVYPSEDLDSRRIACRLNLQRFTDDRERGGFTKVTPGEPFMMKARTFSASFALAI